MGKKQETNSDSEYGELTSPVTSEGSNLNVSLSQLTNVNQLLFLQILTSCLIVASRTGSTNFGWKKNLQY